MKKASNQEILDSYHINKSIWKVADQFGMCGQSVWERLKKLGVDTSINLLSPNEKDLIEEFYKSGFLKGDGKLKEFAKKINRTVPFISRYAKSLGLTRIIRNVSEDFKENISKRNKEWLSKHEHPKGMKGKKHTKEHISKMHAGLKKYTDNSTPFQRKEQAEKGLKTRRKNGNDNNSRGNWKADWRIIGGKKKFFRSRWEANYARYLQTLKDKGEIKDWFHEPETFWFENIKRGSRSYLPDFKVIRNDDTHYWVEVKGYMDKRSQTKIKRFAKYYKNEILILIQGKWFKENSPILSKEIKDWEFGRLGA